MRKCYSCVSTECMSGRVIKKEQRKCDELLMKYTTHSLSLSLDSLRFCLVGASPIFVYLIGRLHRGKFGKSKDFVEFSQTHRFKWSMGADQLEIFQMIN